MSDSHVDHCAVCQSMQSNIIKVRKIAQKRSPTPSAKISTNGDRETNWIHASIRSLKHCIYQRFYMRFLRCFNILTFILMLIPLVFVLLAAARWSPTISSNTIDILQLFPSRYNLDESPQILSTLRQKIEQMENDMETVKAQQNIELDFSHNELREQFTNSSSAIAQEIFLIKEQIANISIVKQTKILEQNNETMSVLEQNIQNVDKNVLKMESNLTEEINYIKNEMQTIQFQEQQNANDEYTESILELRKKISLLQQEIESITGNKWDNLKKDCIQKITAIQSDITEKYLSLETRIQNIENMDKRHSNIEAPKFHKTVDIWETFMLQQNEMNHKLLTLLQSNNEERVPDAFDRADFAVRVVYHTEIMTSSITHNVERKLYYFLTRNYDQNAVRPTGRVGDCTALKQHKRHDVYIIIKLREPIFVDGITIEYIRPSLLQNNVTSAPKNLSLELSTDGYHYCNVFSSYLLYNPLTDGATKYFQFKQKTKEKYRFAKLNVISNFGAAYCCVYRVQIHGDPN